MQRLGGTGFFLSTVLLLAVAQSATRAVQAQTFQVLHTFTGGQDGANPYAGLTFKAGNLYGTTSGGGGNSSGAVFELMHKASGWVLTPLYSFNFAGGGGDGANPEARVIFGLNGTLYGTTLYGGTEYPGYGTVFNLRPSATTCRATFCPWTETVLYRFAGSPDGANPLYGDLIFDQAGNIYGSTFGGGRSGGGFPANGTVYELKPSGGGWSESVLYSFAGYPDGSIPDGGVIVDNNSGNLYGTTTYGGSLANGTVFQLTPSGSGWAENILSSFQEGGSTPVGGLIFDQGNLYGTTSDVRIGTNGSVFELMPSGGNWVFTLLYRFGNAGDSPAGPYSSLTMDAAGNLYGTTYRDGGAGDYGSVFKLTPGNGGWTYTDLHDFTGGSDGAFPVSNVVLDAGGNLYGTASAGGAYGYGVIWEITP